MHLFWRSEIFPGYGLLQVVPERVGGLLIVSIYLVHDEGSGGALGGEVEEGEGDDRV